MSGLQNFSIQFQFNPIWFWIGIVVIIIYSTFVYRHTIPNISTPFKIFLITLRSVALIMILFAIFEPSFSYENIKNIEKKNYVFIDDSRSIILKDSSKNSSDVKKIIESLSDGLEGEPAFITFGNKITELEGGKPDSILFTEGISNYSSITDYLEQNGINPAAAIVVGDGIITDGINPVFSAAKLNVPIFTLGIGDTTERKDIEVGKILFNNFIYAGNETKIQADILNNDFGGSDVTVVLKEGGQVIGTKQIKLSREGFDTVGFDYLPEEPGEKKLQIQISEAENEASYENNRKTFFIKALDSKVNVLIVSGSPSPDLSFIKNAIEENENFRINSLIQVNDANFLNTGDSDELLDSADVFILAGFPSAATSNKLISKVNNSVEQEKKPFLFVLSSGTDLEKLKKLSSILPFAIGAVSEGSIKAQPWAVDISSPIINIIEDAENVWTNLPPVERSAAQFNVKQGNDILSKAKTNNAATEYPLLISGKSGNRRSVAILAKNTWRWKLQTDSERNNFFNNFINAVIKWLNAEENEDRIKVNTDKRLYSLGETVLFNAQVYDETFNPVNDAEIKINIKDGQDNFEIFLAPLSNGMYEGAFESNISGDFNYSAEVNKDGKTMGTGEGKFSIGETEVEALNLRMNKNLLSLLASETGGEFSFPDNIDEIISEINDIFNSTKEEVVEKNEIVLWSNEWLLILSILFLSLEWFLRKRAGML